MSLSREELITKEFYDASGPDWSSAHDTEGFWSDEMARFHELLPGGKILEVGSGGGRDAEDLIDLGYEYTGTDISTGLLAVARKRLPSATFLEQSVYNLSLDNAPFDGFWASAVLLHLPRTKIDEALTSIKRVMKDRAIGFIAIKDGTGEEIEESQHGKRFFTYWTKSDFEDVIERNGFKSVDYIYRPMSEHTKWHSFFVKAEKTRVHTLRE